MAGSRRNDNKRDFPPATKKSHLKYAHHKASRTSSIATCVSFSVFLSRAQLLRSPESRQTLLHFYSASLSSAYASPPTTFDPFCLRHECVVKNFPSPRLLSIRVENDCCFDFSSPFSFAIYLQTKCVRYYRESATDAAAPFVIHC